MEIETDLLWVRDWEYRLFVFVYFENVSDMYAM